MGTDKMKVMISLSISMAFFALLLSAGAFIMSYDSYSKSQARERQEMCETQKLMDFFECMKG